MGVAVLLVDAGALGDDLLDLGAAQGGGVLVRGRGGLGAAAGEVLGRGALGDALGELVLGEDGCCWTGVLVVCSLSVGNVLCMHLPFPGALVVNFLQNSSTLLCGDWYACPGADWIMMGISVIMGRPGPGLLLNLDMAISSPAASHKTDDG